MIGLIWAQAHERVIGAGGTIPFRVPEDQQRFKALTVGHTVVMGRATWESLPPSRRPLPERRNVVVTRRGDLFAPGATVLSDLDAALRPPTPHGQVWVIGGAALYAAALAAADVLEVTEVDVDVAETASGLVRAPEVRTDWVPEAGPWLTSVTGLRYRFVTLQRSGGQLTS